MKRCSVSVDKIQRYKNESILKGKQIGEYYILVKRTAYYLKSRLPASISMDDLIQAGMEGVLQAEKSFDNARGIEFESFAKSRIRGAMLDEVRRISYSTRNIVSTKRLHDATIRSLTQQLGRVPKNSEIADKLGVSVEQYDKERLIAASSEIVSTENSPEELAETQRSSSGPEDELDSKQQLDRLTTAISRLPERSQQILALYYQEEMNLKEIGAILSVSESRISQILTEIASKLRKIMV